MPSKSANVKNEGWQQQAGRHVRPEEGGRPQGRQGQQRVLVKFGYFLSSEEHGPRALVDQAKAAEQAGFDALCISDRRSPPRSPARPCVPTPR